MGNGQAACSARLPAARRSRTAGTGAQGRLNPGAFPDWRSAFSYIAHAAKQRNGEPFLLVFDEFPYAAETEPSLPSILQIAIDHELRNTNAR